MSKMQAFSNILRAAALALPLSISALACAYADDAGPQNSAPDITQAKPDGAKVYANICQACHMENAQGATGAATIPALAGNSRLDGHDYPILVVLYGHGAMPAFGNLLSDDQIAAVLNYVRQNFGNHFQNPVLPAEVKAARVPGKSYSGDF
jgi:mono/diheme cytochrome c family protein